MFERENHLINRTSEHLFFKTHAIQSKQTLLNTILIELRFDYNLLSYQALSAYVSQNHVAHMKKEVEIFLN